MTRPTSRPPAEAGRSTPRATMLAKPTAPAATPRAGRNAKARTGKTQRRTGR